MARRTERLNALSVQKKNKVGVHADGRGLYLQVSPAGTKSWLYRFRASRERWMGLGPYPDVSLADARDKAMECRRTLREGIDPIEHRRAQRATARLNAGRSRTFEECAKAHIEEQRPAWRNPKDAAQWSSTLETYAYPVIGQVPIGDVDTVLVIRVLKPIWHTKTETANRLRQRIEAVVDGATALGLRSGRNPARWHGHLDKIYC